MEKRDRTGTGTRSIFGHQMRFDLAEGFPLVTTKKLHLKSIIYELLWFLRGDTNVQWLKTMASHLGRMGRRQWRARPGLWLSMALLAAPDGGTIDQIANVVRDISRNPDSRRLIVTAWNPADIEDGAAAVPLPVSVLCRGRQVVLPALSALRRYLPGRAVQHRVLCAADHDGGAGDRSKPGNFVHSFGDAHLYLNHLEQARRN